MARTLPTDLTTQFTADSLQPYIACKITLPNTNNQGTTVHKIWTGTGNLTVGSDIFDGAGDFMSVSDVTENQDLGASGLSISLIASSSNQYITILRDTDYQGLPVEAFLGALDPLSQTLVSEGHFKFFSGYADQMLFSMKEKAVVVTLTAENKLIRVSKSSNRYYTHEDQVSEHPNDLGFEFVNAIQEKELLWGRA